MELNRLISLFAEPFDPARDKPQDLGLGGMTTEYIITEEAPDGGFWNIPSVWWRDGKPFQASPELSAQLARDYEAATGKRFPRFESPGSGAFSAMNRSAKGGASKNRLAR